MTSPALTRAALPATNRPSQTSGSSRFPARRFVRGSSPVDAFRRVASLSAAAALFVTTACASSRSAVVTSTPAAAPAAASAAEPAPAAAPMTNQQGTDPRVGLGAGLMNAEEAIWNLRMLSKTPPPPDFVGAWNSDLAFKDHYVLQGNYNGFQIWDVDDPRRPKLVFGYLCPASQSDVSVYENLLFVSGEGLEGRLDCGTEGVPEVVSPDRLRGIRIFDISDIRNPEYIANVQTCRGSHTHSVLVDPDDDENVYVYVSGSATVRPAEELPGCSALSPDRDPNSALFRIEVIRVPLDNPEQAAIVSSPRIFEELVAPPTHDVAPDAEQSGPTQCHDITLYPEIGLAGGACEGYGLLLDISDPVNPRRIDAVADSNFAYWHSATFNNDGTKVLFTDEWGGGSQPKCRASDPYEWGADAIFTIDNNRMRFKSYYKMPAPQTPRENCVAHNGSLIPVPGRDIMVQAWYQGGISVFDWTDPENPIEIAFHDRGPVNANQMMMAGSWSVYWYNGLIVSSEIARGLDIFELISSEYLTQNEINAANTVELDYLNTQGQPKYVWPPTFWLAQAYVDQLERSNGLRPNMVEGIREVLREIERLQGNERRDALVGFAFDLEQEIPSSQDKEKVRMLARTLRDLAVIR